MRLSINYSPQAAELFREGAIALDLWKCSDWPELIAGARATRLPLYLHFDLQAGSQRIADGDLESVATSCADTGTPYVNLHVAPRRADYPGIPVDSQEPSHVDAVLARTVEDIGAAIARFGSQRVVVENLPYRGPDGARLRMGAAPDFIRRLCDETGCGFLLDIAHARTAAHELMVDERAYLSSLPIDRLRELHVNGVDRDEKGRLREHMPITDDDWAILEWCLGSVRQRRWAQPWVVSFEYGGIGPLFAWCTDSAVLAEQAPRLHALVQGMEH
jgi:uncharacterized protein